MNSYKLLRVSLVSSFLFFLLTAPTAVYGGDRGDQWPGWRGPRGTGVASTKLPTSWSPEDVLWKAKLPGNGHSSPAIWEDQIFLTAAEDHGQARLVVCLDRLTGNERWRRTAWKGSPELAHRMNQYASATCAVDGEVVIAFFGRGGLHAFSLEGEPLWSKDLGPFDGKWGTAASPILVGDLAIQNCDAENDAFLLAVNKRTGKTVWKTPRDRIRGWSTPLAVSLKKGGPQEIALNGESGVHGYDINTGKELWFCKGHTGRGAPTVTQVDDLLIAVNGRPGEMFAVRAGGRGRVNSTHEVWRTLRKKGRDLPSPVVVGEYLFVTSMKGIGAVYDAATGKELDTQRIGGNFSASPITSGGLIYVPSEDGEIVVLRAGPKLEIVSRNKLDAADDEIFRASLAAHHGRLYCRSDQALYCIGKQR